MKVEDLIRLVEENGYKVTDRQIYLWTKENLLPVVELKGKGFPLDFPGEANNQLLTICELRNTGVLQYDDLAWSLFLLRYDVPENRIREVMRNSVNKLPMAVRYKKTGEDLTFLIAVTVLNLVYYISKDLRFNEIMDDMLDEAAKTCLGTGNPFTFESHNIPESIVLIKEEQKSPKFINYDEQFELYKNNVNHILTRKNYTFPKGINEELIAKLIFSQRSNYFIKSFIRIIKQVDINKSIEEMPFSEIVHYRDFLRDLLLSKEYEKISQFGMPYKAIYSLYFPLIWDIGRSFNNNNEKLEGWFTGNVQDEPWFKNTPYRAVADMLRALRHTEKDIS